MKSKILLYLGFIFVIGASSVFLEENVVPKKNGLAGIHYPAKKSLTSWEDNRLLRQLDESDSYFASRINIEIHNSTYHSKPQVNKTKLEKIIFFLNYESSRQGFLTPGLMEGGFCHQRAYVLARTLKNAGLDAKVWGLNGHVVTIVKISGVHMIYDPDYGLGPFCYAQYNLANAGPEYSQRLNIPFQNSDWKFLNSQEDDKEYYNMEYLGHLSERQESLLLIIKIILLIIIIFGCILIIFGINRISKKHIISK
jgi:hypothetical protein